MTDDEIIAVVQAHKEGKQIQWRIYEQDSEWVDCKKNEPLSYLGMKGIYHRVAIDHPRSARAAREWWITPNVGLVFDKEVLGSIHVREVIE